jgi:methyl-accepting chemotaxis protein
MDQATQQNAALVEESAAAADSLKTQAQQLVTAVSVFRLAHGDERVAANAPLAAAATVRRAAFKPRAAAPKSPANATEPVLPKTGTDDDWRSF